MELTINTRGNDKQLELCRWWCEDVISTHALFGGAKYGGKSFIACSLIFSDALTYPGTHYFIARESLNDLRKFTRPSIHEVFDLWGLDDGYYKYNGTDNYYQLYNGSKVFFIEARYRPSDPNFARFGSLQMTRGAIEEAGEICSAAAQNLGATVGRWKNDVYNLHPKLVITCNPTKNFLYTDYYKPWKDGTLPEYKMFIQSLPADNKSANPVYYQNLYNSLDEEGRRRLLLGMWEFASSPGDLVQDYDCFTRCFDSAPSPRSGRGWFAADIALEGKDLFTVGHFDGDAETGVVCEVVTALEKCTSEQLINTARRELALRQLFPKDLIVDVDGIGAFVPGYLKGVRQFRGNSRAENSEKFANLKSECAFMLADLINAGKFKIITASGSSSEKETIIGQLEALKKEHDPSGTRKKKLIGKDKMKDMLLGKSPDFLDLFIMGMIPLLKRKHEGIVLTGTQEPGYDPLHAYMSEYYSFER